MTRPITTVAISPERGIVRKRARGRRSPANKAWEKSMTFAKHTSDRRSRAHIRPPLRAEPHPIQDLRRGHAAAPVRSLPQHDSRVRPAPPGALPAEWHSHGPIPRTDFRVSLRWMAAVGWSSMRHAVERRRAIAELRALDDRALGDIGVYRGHVEQIA